VADRASLYYLELGDRAAPVAERLDPGIHVLANGPLHESSPKTDHVRRRVARIAESSEADALEVLRSVLSDHTIPESTEAAPPPPVDGDSPPTERPKELAAACVHTENFGTRSAALVSVPVGGLPHVWVADGPPCRTPFVPVDELWSAASSLSGDGRPS
jgi:uncharacterized protein with NRDE domain